MREKFPEAKLVVHPECTQEVVAVADAVGSTSFIVKYVEEAPPDATIIIGTEINLISRLALEHPDNTNILSQPVADPLTQMPPVGGSPRGRSALEVALSEMASGAKEENTNNSGPWVEKYLNGIVDPPANWCAAFVSWCYSRHMEGLPFRYSLGARDIRSQFKQKQWTYAVSEGTLPEPGDIIVWWRGQPDGWKGHIGLVHSLSEGGVLYTVEGNKGGFPAPVRIFDYVLSRIDRLLEFGRVPM